MFFCNRVMFFIKDISLVTNSSQELGHSIEHNVQ